ncbi:DUF823 domain-containing adhesin [Enterobacteriaceae bacterium H20N1]|uniref:DUF823 domain-containing adhesin n=1 Tax=Dryocola boscaweniae TaxID=2925397 RepID=A0A9X2W4C8_9ENTR|nr:DUF823 domain-containing adhesin [Dryocola boscaweniae]MCT4700495.1 DUF823 domain-containing adhesin [Dryocola boscaweniae]MCT4717651.1 DUF823 domain-containing adhesin [Dryocola boscaweniae]
MQSRRTITQPGGIGVKTLLKFSAQEINAETDVIFTVKTSADTDKAQMWGHMSDSITIIGVRIGRPLLGNEADGKDESREKWLYDTTQVSFAACTAVGGTSISLDDAAKIISVPRTLTSLLKDYGYPVAADYWVGNDTVDVQKTKATSIDGNHIYDSSEG